MAQFCIYCGSGLTAGARFCIACGKGVAAEAPSVASTPVPTPQVAPPAEPIPAPVPAPIRARRSVWLWLGPLLGLLVAGGAVLGIVFLKGGGGSSVKRDQATPEKTFETMRQAVLAGDGGTLYDLMSTNMREEMEQRRAVIVPGLSEEDRKRVFGREMPDEKLMGMPARDFWGAMMKQNISERDREDAKQARLTSVTPDGDFWVTVTYEAGGKTETQPMVRENKLWYLSSPAH